MRNMNLYLLRCKKHILLLKIGIGLCCFLYFTGCAPVPQMYDARTLKKGLKRGSIGLGNHDANDRIRDASGTTKEAETPRTMGFSVGYGWSDRWELGYENLTGAYIKFQLFRTPSGFAGAVHLDGDIYGRYEENSESRLSCITNGNLLVSYFWPKNSNFEIGWTTGIGARLGVYTKGLLSRGDYHHKAHKGLFVPLSMIIGRQTGNLGWYLFGTLEYPLSEGIIYRVNDIEIEYLNDQKFNYSVGLSFVVYGGPVE